MLHWEIISGPKPYPTTKEEDELVQLPLRCASIRYPKSRKDVLALVHRHLAIAAFMLVMAGGKRFATAILTSRYGTSAPLYQELGLRPLILTWLIVISICECRWIINQ